MRRIYVLPLIVLLSLTAVVVMAQEDPPPDEPTPVPTVVPDDPVDEADDDVSGDDFWANLGGGPFVLTAGEGSDFCGSATAITTPFPGSGMDVAAMTQSASDPILNCMWGSPSNLQGYRTVWYKYTPDFNGVMQVSTLPASTQGTNAYDTVLAIHTGNCGALTTLVCNDDKVGFSSEVTINIRRNTTYYIEVADWQAGGNATKMLTLSVKLVPFTSMWKTVNTNLFTLTSRHASIVRGSSIYFLGGRNGAGTLLNNFQRLNTNTGTWSSLDPIPGGGFLNTTAVYLSGTNSVYIPGGSIQTNDQAYSRDHRVYDFGTGAWSSLAEVGKDPDQPGYYSEPFAYAAAAPNNVNDSYFVTGGVIGQGYPLTTTSTVLDQVLHYQPDLNSWFTKTAMISPRYGHVAANLDVNEGTKPGRELCVAGGLNIDNGLVVLIPNGECGSGIGPSGEDAWEPTGNMKVPRYFAHSSVSPDGKWYVYGGIDATGSPVPEVEYYDPETNQWSILGLSYDLFGQNSGQPGLVWPGGGFVGNYLWVAGGSYDTVGAIPNTFVKKVQLLGGSYYLPIVLNGSNMANHSFADARRLSVGQTVSQNFTSQPLQNYNVYKFSINQVTTINARLTSVASTANLNLYIYGENKDLRQSNDLPFPGIDKTVTVTLTPGTYYVVVKYNSSTNFPDDMSDYYQLRVYK